MQAGNVRTFIVFMVLFPTTSIIFNYFPKGHTANAICTFGKVYGTKLIDQTTILLALDQRHKQI